MTNKQIEKKKETAPKSIADSVLIRVAELTSTGELTVPDNYSAENALKSAQLMLQNTVNRQKKPVLQACTPASIFSSLFDMVVQGLNPAKKQCYFIAYGDNLQLSRSYMGTVAVAKRFGNIEDVNANVIYAKDEFEFIIDVENGNKRIKKHKMDLSTMNNDDIIGAYAILTRKDKPPYVEVMTIDEIEAAWKKGSNYSAGRGVHSDFKQEMAKKTVINRACKMFINSSNDDGMFAASYNNTTQTDYEGNVELMREQDGIIDVPDEDIKDQAASAFFGTPDNPEIDDVTEQQPDQKEESESVEADPQKDFAAIENSDEVSPDDQAKE